MNVDHLVAPPSINFIQKAGIFRSETTIFAKIPWLHNTRNNSYCPYYEFSSPRWDILEDYLSQSKKKIQSDFQHDQYSF